MTGFCLKGLLRAQGKAPQGTEAAAGMESWQTVGANSCLREPAAQVCTGSKASPLILPLAILLPSTPQADGTTELLI